MSGATLQQIADHLGYNSRQAVFKATTSLLERQEREVTAEWRAFHLARLERLLLAVWQDALDGDDRAGKQALRIIQEIGRTTGVSGPMRVEASHPGPTIQPRRVFGGMSDAEWLRRYAIARTEALALPPDGVPAQGDS